MLHKKAVLQKLIALLQDQQAAVPFGTTLLLLSAAAVVLERSKSLRAYVACLSWLLHGYLLRRLLQSKQ